MLNLFVQKKILYVLIGLMSLSLAGIIAVQIYWIVDSINGREDQFSFAVKQTLVNVAKEIENQEVEYYYRAVDRAVDSLGMEPDSVNMSSLLLKLRDANLDESITYSNNTTGENYKLNSQILDIELDSLTFTKLINRRVKTIKTNSSVDGNPINLEESFEKINQWDDLEKKMFMNSLSGLSSSLPITQRVTNKQVTEFLTKELKQRQINSSFEYAVALDNMFVYNEKLFEDYPNIKLEEYDLSKKFKVRWGQKYDVEQLIEHAIVHILRHRRQIERFILKLADKNAS